MNYDVPPPGYVPPKAPRKAPRKAKGRAFTFGEAYRTAATVASGYNKAATVQGLAQIAQEVRKIIRG
jgi:hypothetical protein